MIRAYLGWLWSCIAWLAQSVGYWIRPYDMLGDRRRWRWQAVQRCGLPPKLLDADVGGQWVARSRTGKVIATAATARGILAALRDLGRKAEGATARWTDADTQHEHVRR